MFFILPYSTESPIYYRPIATVAMIFVNVVIFVLQIGAGPEAWEPYALVYGNGLHPVQWLTSFFLHGGIAHLIGNMIFLWAFGLVVEGKAGPFVFLLLYLGTGILVNVVNQLIFLNGDLQHSLGASSAIYGLIVISMLWAPQDNLVSLLFMWFLFRAFFMQIRIPLLIAGMVYCLMDFTAAFFTGFEMGTPFLHVMGAIVGFVPGIVFLLFHWVDCDDRDLFSMFRDATGRERKKTKREITQEVEERERRAAEIRARREIGWKSVDMHLAAGNLNAMSKQVQQMQRIDAEMDWEEPRLLQIIGALQKDGNEHEVVRFSEIYLKNFSARKIDVTLNMCRIILLRKGVPRKVLRMIQELDSSQFSEKQKQFARKLIYKAKQLIADGALELGDD